MRLHWKGPTLSMIDMLLGLMIIFMVLALAVIIEKTKADSKSPGELTIELYWWPQKGGDCDVDLWTSGPGLDQPVYYNHHDDHGVALLRDDSRVPGDSSSKQFEMTTVVEVRPGAYAATASLYAQRSCTVPLRVTFKVTMHPNGGVPWVVVEGERVLVRDRDEVTLARWQMTDKGDVVTGSVNQLPTHLVGNPAP